MKVCLVTGGSRGIGRAICLRMAIEGYSLVVNYRTKVDAAREVCTEIEALGGQAWSVQADVTDSEDVKAMFAAISERHGRLDLLVNNAGQASEGLFLLTKPEVLLGQIDQNIRGTVLCTHAALRIMLRQKNGLVVNITSGSAFRGPVGLSAYAAAKSAVNSLTQSIAREVAGQGIRVNAIAPSWVDTEMIDGRRDQVSDAVKQVPLKRMATANEVAAAVAAVARDDMSFYLGQVLVLNGGA